MELLTVQILSFIFLPLLSFIILIFSGTIFSNKSHFIALPIMGLVLINSISLLITSLQDHNFEITNSFEWFSTGDFSVSLGSYVDNVTCIIF